MLTFDRMIEVLTVINRSGQLRFVVKTDDDKRTIIAKLEEQEVSTLLSDGKVELSNISPLQFTIVVLSVELDETELKLIMVTSESIKQIKFSIKEWNKFKSYISTGV
jgi:hypothetical protein